MVTKLFLPQNYLMKFYDASDNSLDQRAGLGPYIKRPRSPSQLRNYVVMARYIKKVLYVVIIWVSIFTTQSLSSTRAQHCLDALQLELGIIASAKHVNFSTVDIREIERWLVQHPNGAIAVGQAIRFECGESREQLSATLAYQEKHARFLRNKRRCCDAISGEIRTLDGQIQQHANHLRSAADAGFNVGFDLMGQLLQKRDSLQPILKSELEHYNQMSTDHDNITGPIRVCYSKFIEGYLRAVTIIETAKPLELEQICEILQGAAIQEDGYAESVLFAHATIRSGRDAAQLSRLLSSAGQRLNSSMSFGFSVINLNRIALSILCETGETGEDVQQAIRTIKGSRDVTKTPAALYAMGTWYAAKGNWKEAARYFTMTRAKVKHDARNSAIASADAIYCLWRQGKFVAPSDYQGLVDDILSVNVLEDKDGSRDWQILRGYAVVALTDGDPKTAAEYVQLAQSCAPPLIKKELCGLEDVFAGTRPLQVGYSGIHYHFLLR